MKAIIHAINDDNVPGLQHLLGSLNSYDVNQPNKVTNTDTVLYLQLKFFETCFYIKLYYFKRVTCL